MTDEAGELPEGWATATLGEIADCRLGKMLDQAKNRGELRSYLRNTNVQWGEFGLDDIKEMRIEDDERERYRVRPGDLVVCEGGEPGRCAVWRDDLEMYLQKALHRVRAHDGVSADYLRWWLQQAAGSGQLEDLFTGSTIKHLPGRQLARLRVPLAPPAEQRRIAERLELVERKRFTATARLRAARAIVARLGDAVLAGACSGVLTAAWRDQQPAPKRGESALEVIRRSRPPGAPTSRKQPEVSEPYFAVPDSWAWAPLGVLAQIRGGIQKKPDRAPMSNAFPYLRVANVLRGRLDLGHIEQFELFDGDLDKYRLVPGDLLIVEGNGSLGEIGRSALWHGEIAECVHQNHLIRVRLSVADPEYVQVFWNSPAAAAAVADLAVTTAGLYNLSVGKIARVQVPVPPLAEQREIVRQVRKYVAIAMRVGVSLSETTTRVSASAAAARSRAFRGELVPTEASLAEAEGRPYESATDVLARFAEAHPSNSTRSRRAPISG